MPTDITRPQIDAERIDAKQVLFIRLGVGNDLADKAFSSGDILFTPPQELDEASRQGQWDQVRRYWEAHAKPRAVDGHVRQARHFWEAGPDTVFINFTPGQMLWCRPSEIAAERNDQGILRKRTMGGWHTESIRGTPLIARSLSGGLLKVRGFLGSICRVEAADYFLRKINDLPNPAVKVYEEAEDTYRQSLLSLVRLLDWPDFEILVDLVFSSSGWRRVGEVGGTQRTIDIEMELPSTGETAFVQVKSSTTQAECNEYIDRFRTTRFGKMFFVYHSVRPKNLVIVSNEPNVIIIGPEKLVEMILEAGLGRWVRGKVS